VNNSPAPPRRRQPRGARSTRGDARPRRSTTRVPITNHGRESAAPWYRRWYSIIIGIGAIAGVVLTMSNLWAQIFPPNEEDVGTITSAHVTRQLYLSDFAKRAPDIDVRLDPASTTTSRSVVVQSQIRQMLAAQTAAVTGTPTDTTTAASTSTPSGTTTPSGTLTPTGTATPACTATPTGTVTPACTVTTGTVTSTATHSGGLTKLLVPSHAYIGAVVGQKVLADSVLADPALPDRQVRMAQVVVNQPTDRAGNPLPPEEVATRLAKALSKVEARHKGGRTDPLGWVVAVNVEVRGLKHVPLLLTWSLDGLDVPVSWAAENVAYRLTPTTNHDTGSVEVWVPDLKKPGKYNVNLTLAVASEGTILTRGEPVEVPNR
jgi:hypothetical protein